MNVRRQKQYAYMCSLLISSMSFAMNTEIETKFPEEVYRFAVTKDGKWLATSENEVEFGQHRIEFTLRTWTQNQETRKYEQIAQRRVAVEPGKDIALAWLKKQKAIAIVSLTEPLGINIRDRESLKAIAIKDDQAFAKMMKKDPISNINLFYNMRDRRYVFNQCRDLDDVPRSPGDVGQKIEGGMVKVCPTSIVWLKKCAPDKTQSNL